MLPRGCYHARTLPLTPSYLLRSTEAFVAPASAVVTRAAVRSAEPAMFGGGSKSAAKKVAPKAAAKSAPKKVKPPRRSPQDYIIHPSPWTLCSVSALF